MLYARLNPKYNNGLSTEEDLNVQTLGAVWSGHIDQ